MSVQGDHPKLGDPEHWTYFVNRNQAFLGHLEPLADLAKKVLFREIEAGPEDRVVFATGRLVFDSFWEVMLLAGNGYGFGAQGILRTMFERVVLSKYLSEHPAETDLFLDYYHIVKWKQVNAVQTSIGNVIPEEKVKEAKAARDAVMKNYATKDCEKCGAKGPVISWNKKDMVALAKEAGLQLQLFECYYRPNEQVHHSVHALMNHMGVGPDGETPVYVESREDVVDSTVRNAHQLLLLALGVQINHFKLESLDDLFEQCKKGLAKSWPDPVPV